MSRSRRVAASSRRALTDATKSVLNASQAKGRMKSASVAAHGKLFRCSKNSPLEENIGPLTNGARLEQASRPLFRPALLAGVAAGALSLSAPPTRAQLIVEPPGAVPDPPCTLLASLDCEGDLSGGVEIASDGADLEEVNIDNLTAAIAPADGVVGVYFHNHDGDTALTVDAAGYGVTTTDAHGVYVRMVSNNGNLTIDVAGDVAVTSDSDSHFGIAGRQPGDGDVSITSDGDVRVGGSHGVFADSGGGNASVTSDGRVQAGKSGIVAFGQGGAATVKSTGNVYAGEDGLHAEAFSGKASVTSNGAITATAGDGIDVRGSAGVSVTSNGDIEAGGAAIRAYSRNQQVLYLGASGPAVATVTSTGNLTAEGGYAIHAYGASYVSITSNGTVNSEGVGLYASGVYGASVKSTGTITVDPASGDVQFEAAIIAQSESGDTTVDSFGNLEAENGYGIKATGLKDIDVKSVGNIKAKAGIRAASQNGGAAIRSDGDIVVTAAGVFPAAAALTAEALHNGGVTIVSEGKLSTAFENVDGIQAKVQTYEPSPDAVLGNISITSTGDIAVSRHGIYAVANIKKDLAARTPGARTGDIVITSTGNVSGDDKAGIYAYAPGGGVRVTSNGAVSSKNGDAIWASAKSVGGRTEINSTGDLYGGNRAIYAYSYAAVDITSNGAVTAGETAITARVIEGDGDVFVDLTGDVAGAAGYGVYARANAGDVAVTANGDVSGGSDAVSASVDGASDITIKISGDVTGGSGAGVRFTGGGTNRLEINGAVSSLSGLAIAGDAGAEQIVSTGNLTGAVSLAAGNDRVEIFGASDISKASFDGGEGEDVFRLSATSDGVFVGGAIRNFEVFEKAGAGTWSFAGEHAFATSVSLLGGVLDLQGTLASPIMTNSGGSLAVGGVGAIGAGTIDGDYAQAAGGGLLVDVDFASGESDLLSVSGTASLAGAVTPTALNLNAGEQTFTILTAAGGVTDNGLTLSPFASPLVDAELVFPNANNVAIAVSVAFVPADVALDEDQVALAGNLEAVFAAGGATRDLAEMYAALFFDIDDDAAYRAALDELSPEVFLGTQAASLFGAEGFSDRLFSCADKTDADTLSREGECIWLRGGGGALDVDGDGRTIGFEEESFSATAGWQIEVAEYWRIGVAAGYEALSLDTDNGADSEGDRFMVGVAAKHQRGPWRLAAALSGGLGAFETTRTVSFGDFADTLLSTQDVTHAAAEMRVGHQFDFDGWYARPFVIGNATWIDLADATETGGGAALEIQGGAQTFLSVTPGVEVAVEFALSKAFSLKPFLRAGARFVDNPELTLYARFVGAPAGTGAFLNTLSFDSRYAEIDAGATLFKLGGESKSGGRFDELGTRAAISLVYESRNGENTKQSSAFLKAAFPF